MVCDLDSNKPVKSLYKYRIISKSCRGHDFTNIDRYRIISSVILVKFLKFISIDICIDFQLNAHILKIMQIKFEYLICWGRGFLYKHKHVYRHIYALALYV